MCGEGTGHHFKVRDNRLDGGEKFPPFFFFFDVDKIHKVLYHIDTMKERGGNAENTERGHYNERNQNRYESK